MNVNQFNRGIKGEGSQRLPCVGRDILLSTVYDGGLLSSFRERGGNCELLKRRLDEAANGAAVVWANVLLKL